MANETRILNDAVSGVANGASVLVCLLAAILVLCLKLYKKLVYRLALYQVLSALALASVGVIATMFINYGEESRNVYHHICIAIGFLLLYTEWMKLLFTMWVTFHLFCFAVLHKNLKKLEVLYVVTSLLVPVLIAAVPLVTHSYGSSLGDSCYIYVNTSVAFIERLALWDGPAMLMLIASSIAMGVMVIKLTCHVCRKYKHEPITDGDQFTKALKQLLPLAAFPVLFFIFEIPVFLFHVYTTQHSTPNEGLSIAKSVCGSLWGMTSGATVIIHISVTRICGRKRKPIHSHTLFTQRVTTGSHASSATHYSLPLVSV